MPKYAKGFILLFVMIATVICSTWRSIAQTNPTYDNWYMKHTGDHSTPVCDNKFDDIEKFNAFYLGPSKGQDPSANPTIYLTFDLGYVNENVLTILDILREENVSAAFFILKNIAMKHPDLLCQMVNDGHLICNHSANHKNMAEISKAAFCKELKEMEEIYKKTTGNDLSSFYRPPEGKFTRENLNWAKEMGYTTVFWSFAYCDWDNKDQPNPKKSLDKILINTHDREIILLHPNSKTNAEILRELISTWRKEGYTFGSLNDLI